MVKIQEILDKIAMIQREDGAYTIEPFIAEKYGTGMFIDAVVLQTDVFSVGIENLMKEFSSVFFDHNKGLVVGTNGFKG